MAYLISRETGGKTHYYAQFYEPTRRPKRKTVTLRTTDKSVARQKIAAIERDYALGVYDPWQDVRVRDVYAEEALKGFRRWVDAQGYSESYKRNLIGLAGRFLKSLPAGTPISQITEAQATRFIYRSDHIRTRRDHYVRLGRFFAFAQESGFIKSSPLENVSVKWKRGGTPKFLTQEEFARLLQAVDDHYDYLMEETRTRDPRLFRWTKDVFILAVYTGMRIGEILHLRWKDVSSEAGMIRVASTEFHKTKNRKDRYIPILPPVRDVLDNWKRPERGPEDLVFYSMYGPGKRVQYRTIQSAFNTCRDLAGIDPEFTFHSLRHTFASWLVQSGMPIADVQRLMGHESLATTMVYAHVTDESVRGHLLKAFARMTG